MVVGPRGAVIKDPVVLFVCVLFGFSWGEFGFGFFAAAAAAG